MVNLTLYDYKIAYYLNISIRKMLYTKGSVVDATILANVINNPSIPIENRIVLCDYFSSYLTGDNLKQYLSININGRYVMRMLLESSNIHHEYNHLLESCEELEEKYRILVSRSERLNNIINEL